MKTYLELCLAELEVNREHVDRKCFAEDTNAALELFIERLEVVLVELKAAYEAKLTRACFVELGIIFILASGLRNWHQQWHDKSAFASFDKHHALNNVWVGYLCGQGTSRAVCTQGAASTTTKVI